MILRRPGDRGRAVADADLALLVLSIFKSWAIWTTINFFDFLIVNPDTVAFLLQIFPDLKTPLTVAAVLVIPVLALIWRLDPFRVRRAVAARSAACLAVLRDVARGAGGAGRAVPGRQSRLELLPLRRARGLRPTTQGWMEAEATPDRLRASADEPCHRRRSRRTSSWCSTRRASTSPRRRASRCRPAIRTTSSRRRRKRLFVVEGSGGPTWYTEYNVLTGLSARSYGRLKFYVTRIAAGRVERGLPASLRRCGYKTFSLYPAYGAFLSARRFQTTTGVERFIDLHDMGGYVEPDRFYYDQAVALLSSERNGKPKFIFVYTVANHFPWHERYLPEETPDWRDLGNLAEVDEYIRRQTMSARDYRDFIARLKRDFPDESFLVVRFGDHQPFFASGSSTRRSTRRRSGAAWRRRIRATSRPTTPSTRSTSRRPICRRRSTGSRRPIFRW